MDGFIAAVAHSHVVGSSKVLRLYDDVMVGRYGM